MVKIAIGSIVLGIAVMILTVSIVTGFKNEIKSKAIGFSGDVVIGAYTNNNSFEQEPLNMQAPFLKELKADKKIKHIQPFATKNAIIKTADENEGIIIKGVDGNYDWTFIDHLAAVVAGTKYRGEFEQRLKTIMEEVKHAKNSVILFIDELHTVIGAGAAEGAIDASNMLKPALARGELQCIGATTLDEYRKHIEHDAALERRFQPIIVEPPTVDQTVSILQGLKERYETHHKVHYDDGSLRAAAELSERYITDRFLPDKAIDLIDEAGARARLQTSQPPEFILAKENEMTVITKEKEAAIARQEFEKAAHLRDTEKEMRKKYDEERKKWKSTREENGPVINSEDIAQLISKWTRIPVTRLTETESDKLLKMESELHKRVIGQHEPIIALSKAIRRSRTGMKDPRKPIGGFIVWACGHSEGATTGESGIYVRK